MFGRIGVAGVVVAMLAGPALAEQRCGYLENPTPGNWTLSDADGDWLVSSQGDGREAAGMDLIPDLTVRDFIVTNPPDHGYACVCLGVQSDATAMRILRITSVKQLSIRKCTADPNLTEPQ
jgi:hypothetical protein